MPASPLTSPLTSPLPRRSWRAGTALAAVLAAAVLTGCSGGADAAAAGGGTSADAPASSASPSTPSQSSPGQSSPDQSSPGQSSEAPAGSASPSAPAGSTVSTLQSTLLDFTVEMPSTEIAAGTYTIEVTNEGRASHDLVIADAGGGDVAASEVLAPGASGTVEVTLEPGEYAFYCSVGSHRGMGMELVVTVV